jgi:hypothetical protein
MFANGKCLKELARVLTNMSACMFANGLAYVLSATTVLVDE